MEVPLWRIVGRCIASTASVYPNLTRTLVPTRRNQLWVADITYIRLAARADASGQAGVGPLQMAINKRAPAAGIIHHSNHGDYAKLLGDLNIQISMSAKAKIFMKTLKHEEGYRVEYLDMADARRGIRHLLERTYNRNRSHSTLGYKLPVEFDCSPRAGKDPA